MTFKRILDIVDDSNGFMKAGSDLPVGDNQEGAEEIIEPTNHFLEQIPAGVFDFALFKLDTHFAVEYDLSPEAQAFPLHCEYGTEGWALAVNSELIDESIPVFYMTKNTFDMWDRNPVSMEALLDHHNVASFDDLPFKSAEEKQAYENLYRITEDPACLVSGPHRDEFLAGIDAETEVVLAGVASNFCDADAIYGYLEKGASVIVLNDLVKGIPLGPEGQKALLDLTGIDRTQGGTIEEVFATDRFKPFVESGQLRMEHSTDFLARVQPAQAPSYDNQGPA